MNFLAAIYTITVTATVVTVAPVTADVVTAEA